MTVGVLALQGSFREHLSVLSALSIPGTEVKTADNLAAVDRLIIPGGESTAIGVLGFAGNLISLIAERITSGMPVYGTCAGMIMLAQSIQDAPSSIDYPQNSIAQDAPVSTENNRQNLSDKTRRGDATQNPHSAITRGALACLDVTVHRNAFGRQVNSFEGEVTFLNSTFSAPFIRAPKILEVKNNVEVLSRLPSGEIVGVRQGNVMATSFHPELTKTTVVHEYFLGLNSGRSA